MQKLYEIMPTEGMVLLESNDKNYIGTLRFPFVVGDVENRNKRIYSSSLLQREIGKINERLKTSKIAGMLEHNKLDGKQQLDRVSHVFTKFEWDEKKHTGFAQAKILNTNKGRDLKVLLKTTDLGASLTGHGTVGVDGNICDDFKLNSVDLVSNPSFGDATKVSGEHLIESLNSLIEKDQSLKKAFLIQEQRAAGYFEPKKEEKKIPEGMSSSELLAAGGPGRSTQ